MEVSEIFTENDCNELIKNIKRGANYAQILDNIGFETNIADKIEVINAYLGGNKLRFERFQDKETLEIYDYCDRDDIFIIVSSIENSEIPLLNDDDFAIKTLFNDAYNNKKKVFIHAHERLHKYAEKLAFQKKIQFKVSNSGVYFDGSGSSLPVSTQIENAYRDGKDKITFKTSDVSLSTMRGYASNLKRLTGEKIRCSVVNNIITIYLKKESETEQHINKIKAMLDQLPVEEANIIMQSLTDHYKQEELIKKAVGNNN